ncbi:MAG: hypothetical protein P8X89_08920 [Reinekea sp.]
MGAPAIFEKQIEIKLLHPASTELKSHGFRSKSAKHLLATKLFGRSRNLNATSTKLINGLVFDTLQPFPKLS